MNQCLGAHPLLARDALKGYAVVGCEMVSWQGGFWFVASQDVYKRQVYVDHNFPEIALFNVAI